MLCFVFVILLSVLFVVSFVFMFLFSLFSFACFVILLLSLFLVCLFVFHVCSCVLGGLSATTVCKSKKQS